MRGYVFSIGSHEYSRYCGRSFGTLNTGKVPLKPFADQFTIHYLGSDPVALEFLSRLKRRAAPAERIKNDLALAGRHLNAPPWNDRLQFVHMPAGFELAMTGWGSIVPKVRKIQSERI